MSETVASKSEKSLSPESEAKAAHAIRDLFEHPEQLGLTAGSPEFNLVRSPTGESGGTIEIERDGCYLHATREWSENELLINPTVESLKVMVEPGLGLARAAIDVENDRLWLADYVDKVDLSKTMRPGTPTAASLQAALETLQVTIELLQETAK